MLTRPTRHSKLNTRYEYLYIPGSICIRFQSLQYLRFGSNSYHYYHSVRTADSRFWGQNAWDYCSIRSTAAVGPRTVVHCCVPQSRQHTCPLGRISDPVFSKTQGNGCFRKKTSGRLHTRNRSSYSVRPPRCRETQLSKSSEGVCYLITLWGTSVNRTKYCY